MIRGCLYHAIGRAGVSLIVSGSLMVLLAALAGCAPTVHHDPAPLPTVTGDGSHVVGVDIASGRWTAPGSRTCSWSVVRDGRIVFQSGQPGQNASEQSVLLDDGQSLHTVGCGAWTHLEGSR